MIGLKAKITKRFATWTASALVGALVVLPSPAQAKYASLVMDAYTGNVLHEINADTQNYPASLTKMMTLYMIFDRMSAGTLTPQTQLQVSRRAARQPASKLGLQAGTTISVDDAVRALVTKSANDVASVIADNLGGGERQFALMMTAKARELGMSKTIFRNASGLPHRGQLSTARDMAHLARRLLADFPQYYNYFALTSFEYDGRKHSNHNNLLDDYEGTDGIKTGYIRASGFNLVASVKRGNHRLIGVVFGGKSSGQRDHHMVRLLDKGFAALGAPTGRVMAKATPEDTPEAKVLKVRKGFDWGIQVGAFAKKNPAYEAAEDAIGRVPQYLADGTIQIEPLARKKRSPLYRARILGISRKQAYRACRKLENMKIGCMELRITDPVQLAENDR